MKLSLALLSLLPCLLAQSTLRGHLLVNGSLEIDTTIVLSSSTGVLATPVLEDGSFAVRVPKAGEYVLSVNSRRYSFLTYALRLTGEGEPDVVKAQVYQPGPEAFSQPGMPVAHPLLLPAVGKTVYFDESGGFDLVKVVTGNPLILLLGLGVVMTMGMPALLKMIDPETMKEITETQSEMHSKMAAFQNMDPTSAVSKFLAPVAPPPEEPAPILLLPQQKAAPRKRR
ncbi:hypothetical protein RQP46_009954 [Phenoliferia psychrophenolica]